MAVPSSGALSLFKIAKEMEFNNYSNTSTFTGYSNLNKATPISLKNMSTGAGGFDAINSGSSSKPNGSIPLRSAEVNRLLGKVDELELSKEHVAIPFSVGESIKVVDGPFNGFTGTIEHVNEEKRKLQVMVKIFGRNTPLELSYM